MKCFSCGITSKKYVAIKYCSIALNVIKYCFFYKRTVTEMTVWEGRQGYAQRQDMAEYYRQQRLGAGRVWMGRGIEYMEIKARP